MAPLVISPHSNRKTEMNPEQQQVMNTAANQVIDVAVGSYVRQLAMAASQIASLEFQLNEANAKLAELNTKGN